MREAIEQVIAEMEETIRKNIAAWKATRDEWFKGVVHANEEAINRLKEVLANE